MGGWANSVLSSDEMDQRPLACTLAGNTEADTNAGTWYRSAVENSVGFPTQQAKNARGQR